MSRSKQIPTTVDLTECPIPTVLAQSTTVIVWFGGDDDESEHEFENELVLLQKIAHDIYYFKVIDECMDFITDLEERNIIFLGAEVLIKSLIHFIHPIAHMDRIYIIDKNQLEGDVSWMNAWPKIKGVYESIRSMCGDVTTIIEEVEKEPIPISFVSREDTSDYDRDRLEPSFLYMKLFKEILLNMDHDKESLQQFTNYCRQRLSKTSYNMKIIDDFEHNYSSDKAIYWYTCESFIYQMVNQALRLLQTDIILIMGFFLVDLHRQIERIYAEQIGPYHRSPFTVYRGQMMSKNDFERLQRSVGGLISFNSFLSTSRSKELPLLFAQSYADTSESYGIVFVINVTPHVNSVPFADVSTHSYYNENEILFSMLSVFRINSVHNLLDLPHLYEASLSCTSDTDKELDMLFDFMYRDINLADKRQSIGKLLLQMDQPKMVHQLYPDGNSISSIEDTTSMTEWLSLARYRHSKTAQFNSLSVIHSLEKSFELDESYKRNPFKLAQFFTFLGLHYMQTVEYERALMFCQGALEIRKKILPKYHPLLAIAYGNVGRVYDHMGVYSNALILFKTAVDIEEKSLSANHPSLANSYSNIGTVYNNMGEYLRALSFHREALEIRQKALPNNHPLLGDSNVNIGQVFNYVGEYSMALSCYQRALEIQQRSLPINHPILADSYSKIGVVYDNIGQYFEALSSYEKATEILQMTVPSNHLLIANLHSDLSTVYNHLGKYSKALLACEKALEIRKTTLPMHHPSLALAYSNIAIVYTHIGEYVKAIPLFKKVLEIQEKSLPKNHPQVADTYSNIGRVYNHMKEYSKALSFGEKSLEIREKSLPAMHPSLADSYSNIGTVYKHMNEYLKALSFFEKALNIENKRIPGDHPSLAHSYDNIGTVCKQMGEFSKALSCYHKSIDIQQKRLPVDHSLLATSFTKIGLIYHQMQEYREALKFYQRALDLWPKIIPYNQLSVGILHNCIGYVYHQLAEHDEALKFYKTSFEILKNVLPSNHNLLRTLRSDSYSVYNNIQESGTALSFYESALNIYEKCFSSDESDLTSAHGSMGDDVQ